MTHLLARARPVTARASEILGLARPIERAAIRVEEVVPAETGHQPPVLMAEADRDRVTGAHPWSSLEAEWARVAGGEVRYPPLHRYLFRDVLASPWGIFSWRDGVNREGSVDRDMLRRAPVVALKAAHHALPRSAARYFGHILLEALPAVELARPGDAVVLPLRADWPHARAYAEALAVPRIDADLAIVRDLSYVDDRWVTRSRLERYARLHARVQEAIAGRGTAPSPEGIYMWRGETGQLRRLINEEDFARALQARGFAILDPGMSLEKMWETGGGAARTAGLEGSQWNHAPLMARHGATHLLIAPSDLFNLFNAQLMPATQGRMAVSVAEAVEGGYRIDIDGALRLLDALDRATAQ